MKFVVPTGEEMLSKEGICLAAEDVGGTINRKVILDLASGQTIVHSNAVQFHHAPEDSERTSNDRY